MPYKHKLFLEEAAATAIVVGDLHLYPGSDEAPAQDLEALSRTVDVCGLLVLNGDVLDLDRVEGEPGLGVGPSAAAARAVRFMEAFPGLGRAVRTWVGRGGKVVWLAGNHDAEVCLDSVQDAVRKHLNLGDDGLVFGEKLVLNGEVTIEHGHRLDPDNCYYPTTAAAVRRGNLESLPMGSLITRMLLTRIPEYERSGDHRSKPWQVFTKLLHRHGLSVFRMVALYFLAALRICVIAGKAAYRSDAAPWSSTFGVLAAARRLYLDRLAAALLAVAGLAATLVSFALGAGSSSLFGLVLLAPAAVLLVPPKRAKQYKSMDIEAVRVYAGTLAAEMGTSVVMGHTHQPEMGKVDLEQGRGDGLYLNHGSFSRIHDGARPLAVYKNGSLELSAFPPPPRLDAEQVA